MYKYFLAIGALVIVSCSKEAEFSGNSNTASPRIVDKTSSGSDSDATAEKNTAQEDESLSTSEPTTAGTTATIIPLPTDDKPAPDLNYEYFSLSKSGNRIDDPLTKLFFIVDDSSSMKEEQQRLSNQISTLLDPIRGQNVSAHVYTTTDSPYYTNYTSNRKNEGMLPPLVRRSPSGSGSNYISTNGSKQKSYSKSPANSIFSFKQGSQSLLLSELHNLTDEFSVNLKLETNLGISNDSVDFYPSMSDQDFDDAKNSLASNILSVGVSGSQFEMPLCTMFRILSSEHPDILSSATAAAFIIISDQDHSKENEWRNCLSELNINFDAPRQVTNTSSCNRNECMDQVDRYELSAFKDERVFNYRCQVERIIDGQSTISSRQFPVPTVYRNTATHPAMFSKTGTCNEDQQSIFNSTVTLDSSCINGEITYCGVNSIRSSNTLLGSIKVNKSDIVNDTTEDGIVEEVCNKKFEYASGQPHKSLNELVSDHLASGDLAATSCYIRYRYYSTTTFSFPLKNYQQNAFGKDPTKREEMGKEIEMKLNEKFGDNFIISSITRNSALDQNKTCPDGDVTYSENIDSFLALFPNRTSRVSICADDYAPAVEPITDFLTRVSYKISIDASHEIVSVKIFSGETQLTIPETDITVNKNVISFPISYDAPNISFSLSMKKPISE